MFEILCLPTFRFAKVSPLYNVLWECIIAVYIHVNYIVYKYFDRSLHVGSSDPTCVQSFRPVQFCIQTDKNKKNWRYRLCLGSNSHQNYTFILNYHPVVSKVSESVNPNF